MATPLAVPVFLALLALPKPFGENERAEEREVRLARLAVAIGEACDGEDECASALVATAWGETRLARKWHEMGARRDTKGYAISLWSLHVTSYVPYQQWVRLGGIGGTEESAQVAARILLDFRRRCGSWVGAFGLFATGKSCRWKGAGSREWTRRRVLGWIRAVERQQ